MKKDFLKPLDPSKPAFKPVKIKGELKKVVPKPDIKKNVKSKEERDKEKEERLKKKQEQREERRRLKQQEREARRSAKESKRLIKKMEKEKARLAKNDGSRNGGHSGIDGDDMSSKRRRLGSDDEESIIYIDENGKRRRAKRRSKNDLDGRDYKCSFCAKTYLSYPALYTHMKNKHSKGEDAQQLLLNSGRGRGRPKKNAGRVTTIDPESDDYFKTLDKGGGPTDPLF